MSDKHGRKEVLVDWRRFDPLQMRLLEEIARDLRQGLQETGLDDEKIREAVENLTFRIASIVDGSRVMPLRESHVRPVLTFATDACGTHLVGAEGGSWMHEYAIGLVEQIFDAEPAPTKTQERTLRIEFPKGKGRGFAAYSICVDIARPDKAVLAELRADCARFKRLKLSLKNAAAIYLTGPNKKRMKIDARRKFKGDLVAAEVFRVFRAARKKP